MLTDRDRERYSRQILMDRLGEEGQERLKSSTVGVFGCGGLGTITSLYFAAAGVGRLVLVDSQKPDLSNLNRQVLHWEKDVTEGVSKAESAKYKLSNFNRDIVVEAHTAMVTEDNIEEFFGETDMVVDCLDNFESRLLLNRFCIETGRPMVYAAVHGFYGQLTSIIPGKTPCLRCIFPESPPPEPFFPIIGVTPGVLGLLEATETIKNIVGLPGTLRGELLIVDLLSYEMGKVKTGFDNQCSVCGKWRK
ncbi:HesA/MoeB/ThiF family protein [Candidatus Hakubella thermalkaliphila]|uniref:Molybdopterin-synthase adenylyltransferase n=1 Tax=Candidatus Hakubella thermalkaliphila TaxID=2754717 RepID=A0A6V8Q4U2_9ACTN|nr:HesA/MoeB/ThiF family protein [Candidatus Hakubella thermalkaliphila]GFP29522.1 molybdopterin-synthase adenylyltransferase [Candidatus Hakubella thermalkaliphila]GFP38396.1 molybdopterin-synthase adenylyltransferase [Candidatus Hakubella thermalkaliphila]